MNLFVLLALQIFFLMLKVTHTVAWSWWVIFTPLIVWVTAVIVMGIVVLTAVYKIERGLK